MSAILHPECLKIYISNLGEDNDTIRQNSIDAILKYGANAIPDIIEAAQNENWVTRNSAIICLQNLCENQEIELEPIIEILLAKLGEKNPIVKCTTIKALGVAYKTLKKTTKK